MSVLWSQARIAPPSHQCPQRTRRSALLLQPQVFHVPGGIDLPRIPESLQASVRENDINPREEEREGGVAPEDLRQLTVNPVPDMRVRGGSRFGDQSHHLRVLVAERGARSETQTPQRAGIVVVGGEDGLEFPRPDPLPHARRVHGP